MVCMVRYGAHSVCTDNSSMLPQYKFELQYGARNHNQK